MLPIYKIFTIMINNGPSTNELFNEYNIYYAIAYLIIFWLISRTNFGMQL